MTDLVRGGQGRTAAEVLELAYAIVGVGLLGGVLIILASFPSGNPGALPQGALPGFLVCVSE